MGTSDGLVEGDAVGLPDGLTEGDALGERDGDAHGDTVGAKVGSEGNPEGLAVGKLVGRRVW